MTIDEVGAICFGIVIGWVTYRTLRRTSDAVKLSDIATVIGAVGGAAVTALYNQGHTFAWYAIGLAVGFFGYLVLGHTVMKDSPWLGGGS
jgi:O-antigen/teichoic acid export membrane protein